MYAKIKDHTDQRFGRLIVIGLAPKEVWRGRGRTAEWACICECGGFAIVPGTYLRAGSTRSCGCLRREVSKAAAQGKVALRHGHTAEGRLSPTYNSWKAMKRRCTDPADSSYPNYGGRGITICDEWIESFDNFLRDMGERPEAMTLDRIDPDGNYEPGNCRWADWKTQRANRRPQIAAA